MIDNMFAVMKRINELRSRFGLNRPGHGDQDSRTGSVKSYREYHDAAMASQEPAGGERSVRGMPGIQGRTVEEIRKLADYYASVNHVPSGLVKAVIETESNYNPRAVSPKGAKGLMQLMPSVIKDFGVSDPFDPNENISAGTGLLKDLLTEYGGDYATALAAYNAGRRAVNESGGMPGFSETREYVKKVIDSYLKNSE